MSVTSNTDHKLISNKNQSNRVSSSTSKATVKTKADRVLSQLRRSNGTSINQLIASTGWQAHSLRSVISSLRKQGISIIRSKAKNGVTIYRAAKP